MTETSRKANLEFGVQNNTKSGLDEIKRDIQVIGREAEKSGEQARTAFDGMGKSSEDAAAKFTRSEARMVSGLRSTVEQMEVALRQSKGLADAFQFKAEFRGFDAGKFDPMLARVRELESQLSIVKAAEAEWAAQNAFAKKHLQAKELAKASQYASWWAAELEKVEAAERKVASETAFIKSLKSQSDAIGKTRADLLEMQAAQMGVSAQAAPYVAKLREAEKGLQGVGMSAKATAAAMRTVPAQFQDIIVSLQGGQAPMTVFLQQGSQLSTVFGGAGNAAKALSTYVLGLVNPYTLAAAAVAALGVAYYQGSQEADNFRMAIATTGNASGMTTSQLREYARQIDSVVGTQAEAAAGLAAFVAAGVRGGDELRRYTQTAIEWEKATGEGVDKTAEKFASLQKDPLAAVIKLNEGTNFLTVSVYDQIKALEEQGKKTEAAKVAMDALDGAMSERAKTITGSLGYIERGWNGITGAAKGAWDAMLNVGRAATYGDKLAQVRKELAELMPQTTSGFAETAGGAATGRGSSAYVKKIQERIDALRLEERALMGKADAEQAAAIAQEKSAQQTQARIDFDKKYAKHIEGEITLQHKLAAARREGEEAGRSEADIKKVLAAITEEHNKKGASAAKAYNKELADQKKLVGELAGLSSTFYKEWESLNKQYAQGRISLQALEAAQAKLLSKQPFAIALAKEEEQATKARIKAYDEEVKAQEKLLKQRQDAAQKAQEAVQKARDEEEAYVLAAAQGISLAEAVAQIAAARAEENYQKALGQGLDGETLLALQQERDARRELIELMAQKGVREANTKAQKEIAKDWEKLSQTIGRTLSDYIMGGGKDAATYLKRLFATLVLEPVVNYGMQSLLGAVGMGSGPKGSSNNALGTLSNLSSLKNVWGYASQLFGGAAAGGAGFGSGVGLGVGATTAGLTVGTGASLGATGAGLGVGAGYGVGAGGAAASGAAGAGFGQYLPYLAVIAGMVTSNKLYGAGFSHRDLKWDNPLNWAAGLETRIAKAIGVDDKTANILFGAPLVSFLNEKMGLQSTPHTGAGAIYSGGGLQEGAGIFNRANFGMGQSKDYAASAQSVVSGIATQAGATLDAIAKAFDIQGGFRVATAFADDRSKDGAWGSLQIADAVGNVLLDWEKTRQSKWAPKELSNGEKGFEEYTAAVRGGVLTAIQTMNLAGWAKDMFAAAEGAEGLQAALQGVGVVLSQFDAIGKSVAMFADLSGDMQTAMLKSAGGMDALTGYVSSFNQGFFTEAERMQLLTGQVRDALAGLSIGIDPAMGDKAKAEFKAAVQAATDAGNGELVVQLLSINQAFAATADYAQGLVGVVDELSMGLSDAMRGLLEDRRSLEAELLRAQGDDAGYQSALRAIAIEGFGAAEIAAWDFNTALQAQIDALDAATAAAQESAAAEAQRVAAVAQQRLGLEGQLLQLQGNTAELRARELAALDESNRSLQEWIWALQDSATASQAAAQAAEQAAQKQAQAAEQAAQKQAQALSGSWGSFGTMAGLAAQHLGNSSGLAAQLGVVQQSYAGATDTSGRVAALQQIIGLEQGIWNTQQQSRQAEAQAAQGRVAAAREQLQSVNQLISAAQSLGKYAESLGFSEASGLTDFERFDALQGQYLQLLGKAKAGDVDAMGELQGVASGYLGLAEQMSQSQSAYSVLSGTIAAELASTAALSQASATSQAAQYERSIAAAETAAATASAQFSVSTATQKLIDELLQESALGFASEATLTQKLIDQGAMTESALLSLPKELSGAIGATLVPAIRDIASVIASAAGVDGSHASGLSYVPFDGYRAEPRKGERVLTAAENRVFGMPVMQQSSNAELVAEIRALREDNRVQAGEIVRLNARIAKIFERWDGDGMPVTREETIA